MRKILKSCLQTIVLVLLFDSMSCGGEELDDVLRKITSAAERQSKLILARPSAYEITRKSTLSFPGKAKQTFVSKLWLVLTKDGGLIVNLTPQGTSVSLYNPDYGAYMHRKGSLVATHLTDLEKSGYILSNKFRPQSNADLDAIFKAYLGLDTKPAQLDFFEAIKAWKANGGTARCKPLGRDSEQVTVYFTGWPRVTSEIAFSFDRESYFLRGVEMDLPFGASTTTFTEMRQIENASVPVKWIATVNHKDGTKSSEEGEWRDVSINTLSFNETQLRFPFYGLPEPGRAARPSPMWPWVVGLLLIGLGVLLFRKFRP